jgi:hypothetical protein
MHTERQLKAGDFSQYLAGGGCLLSVPVFLGLGFKYALSYAKGKEHQFAHQVEEVELEGKAAEQLEAGMTALESVQRFVKKLERITDQYGKMGGRFSPKDFENERNRLAILEKRVQESDSASECKPLIDKAQKLLQQYAPQG